MAERDDDRRLIGDSARALLERAGGVGRARRIRDAGSALDREAWKEMAALGWFSMLLPEGAGGSGFEPLDILELLATLGGALAPEPVVPTLATVRALSHAAGPERGRLLAEVVSGATIALIVPAAPAAGLQLAGGRLNGESATRTDLHLADAFLLGGEADGAPVIVAVPKDRAGVSAELARTVDGGTAGLVRCAGVEVDSSAVVARGAAAQAALQDAADLERLGHAAVLVGLMERALALTADYLKTRVQFGVPIGSFQALQHRAASMHVDFASARATVREAARSFGHDGQTKAAAAAKAYASEAALRVTREAIQLHGAIGFTDEYDIGLFHRRAMALVAADGGAAAARRAWTEGG